MKHVPESFQTANFEFRIHHFWNVIILGLNYTEKGKFIKAGSLFDAANVFI